MIQRCTYKNSLFFKTLLNIIITFKKNKSFKNCCMLCCCQLLHVHCCCWCSILMLVSNGAWGGGDVGSHFIAGTPVCRIGTDRSCPSTWYICNLIEKSYTFFHHKPIFTFIHFGKVDPSTKCTLSVPIVEYKSLAQPWLLQNYTLFGLSEIKLTKFCCKGRSRQMKNVYFYKMFLWTNLKTTDINCVICAI